MTENLTPITLRLELNCGLEDYQTKYSNLNQAIAGQQCVVAQANAIGIDGYQSETSDRRGMYSDSYLYPRIDQLEPLLQITKTCGWAGDILDIPPTIPLPEVKEIRRNFGEVWQINYPSDF